MGTSDRLAFFSQVFSGASTQKKIQVFFSNGFDFICTMSFLILFFDVLVAVVLVILVVATYFDASHFFGYVRKLHRETVASVLAGGGWCCWCSCWWWW